MAERSDRLDVSLEAVPVQLGKPELHECGNPEHDHDGTPCVRIVEHHAIEMRLRDPGKPGVYVEAAGVARVEVHTNA